MANPWILLQAQATQGGTQWWQIVTGILAIPVAFITIWGGYQTSRKTRLETRNLERQLDEQQSQPGLIREQAGARTGITAVRVEGYVVRFIILYLAYQFWGLFVNFLSTVVGIYFAVAPYSGGTLVRATTVVPAVLANLVNVVIFLSIGYPLLVDILRDFGISRRMLWFRDERLTRWSGRVSEQDERGPTERDGTDTAPAGGSRRRRGTLRRRSDGRP
jgi:hypothetical protein